MDLNRTLNPLLVETVKGDDHFLIRGRNTPAGRLAAKRAVRVWLLDCELDFNRRDAEQLWGAIDACRFSGRPDAVAQGGVQWNARRNGREQVP